MQPGQLGASKGVSFAGLRSEALTAYPLRSSWLLATLNCNTVAHG
jgi:hypothetical protein